MKQTPIDYEIVKRNIAESNLSSIGQASIREIKKLVDNIEAETGEKYIRMEMGIPGLPPVQIGVEKHILRNTAVDELAKHYFDAFSTGRQVLPYFSAL